MQFNLYPRGIVEIDTKAVAAVLPGEHGRSVIELNTGEKLEVYESPARVNLKLK